MQREDEGVQPNCNSQEQTQRFLCIFAYAPKLPFVGFGGYAHLFRVSSLKRCAKLARVRFLRFVAQNIKKMADTEAVDESMEGAEQGEEYVAETETSQTEGGEEGETDENNTTYNTDAVEEEVPTQVDPDGATLEDIFGVDEDEEEQPEYVLIIIHTFLYMITSHDYVEYLLDYFVGNYFEIFLR